ncbi:aminodeoxychorismate synthase component I [Polymorphobacter arshaanensis]|uniref:Probable branched-chain-amino-acid aminotransferase n=1 Tax=Glacieibacterium arshaanense TaxID=2511025 RepID=A0A4Y9EP74_9SPHN|nr:aminodeoxychorismate synthase component I [Polymorphobacter arshaanensis]
MLDDARERGARARLFTGLETVIRADSAAEVMPALAQLRGDSGNFAGFIGFEAGYALEPKLAHRARVPEDGLPLLWFGRFAQVARIGAETLDGWLAVAGGAQVGHVEPGISEAQHAVMIDRIATLIAAGDIYQANATFQAQLAVGGHPLALYRRLRGAQAAPYGALIYTGTRWILSFSPELFFTLQDGRLKAKPMKGTAPRGPTCARDDAAATALAADIKNRAENLMIVDLLRNDLSRVALAGSVAVPELFKVERYPTVLQMTSTVTAQAAVGITPVDVLTALFPCGSVTGAPKIRAMEVIADVEATPRGLYTGSIGYISGDEAAFNVAIRTLILDGNHARLGLGSGIVADSTAAAEWQECLDKAAFVRRTSQRADVIETLRWEPGTGLLRRDRHLARAAETLAYLGYAADFDAIGAALDAVTFDGPARVRLLIAASGAFAVQVDAAPPRMAEPVRVALAPLPVAPTDWRLFHKTTDRAFYDDARRASGAFEVLFVRPDGHITEGSFTNVFVERDGVLLTPRGAEGLLPGILRAELLDSGRAVEADLTIGDLEHGFLVGNALRGLIPARLGD